MLFAVIPRRAIRIWLDKEYWGAQADRAIATNLVRTNALLAAHRRSLELTRRALRLKASWRKLAQVSH